MITRQVLMLMLASAMVFFGSPVNANDIYGFVDTKGRLLFEPQFGGASDFSNGFAHVCPLSERTHTIDCANAFFIDKRGVRYPESRAVEKPSSGSDDNLYRKYKIDGKTILENTFYSVWSSRRGLLFVKRWYDFSVADADGRILKKLPSTWQIMGENPETGNQWCKVGDQALEFTGRTDSEVSGFEPLNKMPSLFAERYAYFDTFHEGLAAVMDKDGRWAYIDGSGDVKIRLPDDCSNAQQFSEGLAAVSIGGHPRKSEGRPMISPWSGATFGFIDKTGKFVIPPKFPCPHTQWHSAFKNGLAIATANKDGDVAFGFVDHAGSFVIQPKYKSVRDFSDGMCVVNGGVVGFDREAWIEYDKKFQGLGSVSRIDQLIKFMRQYDLIGMTAIQLTSLLGEPNAPSWLSPELEYTVQHGCTGSIRCVFRLSDGVVRSYQIRSGRTRGSGDTEWISKNLKPDFDADICKIRY